MKKNIFTSFQDFPFSVQDKENLLTAIRSMQFSKNSPVFSQGEICTRIYLVRSGLVKLNYLTPDGKETIKSFIAEGGLFGALSCLLAGESSTYSAIAMEDLVVESLDYAQLQQLSENSLALQKLLTQFFQQLALSKEIREYEFLCLSAQQRFSNFCTRNPQLVSRIRQADMALYLGITPIALSRLKGRNKSLQD